MTAIDPVCDIRDKKLVSRKLPFDRKQLKGWNWAGSGLSA
jgi:hypothetical protein